METINIIAVWLVIAYLIAKPYIERIQISIERTFWQKKPYGVSVTLWRYKFGECPNDGRGIFHFNWRNPENIKDEPNAT